MASQESSGAEIFDLTGDDDADINYTTALPLQSAIAGPSHIRPRLPLMLSDDSQSSSSPSRDRTPARVRENSSDIEMLDEAPVDEEVRRRNVENRRQRFSARGIIEDDDPPATQNAPAGQQRPDSVAEVIIISDSEENDAPNAPVRRFGADDDTFGEERRRRRRWNIWEDDLEERRRHPNARQAPVDLFDFDFPAHLIPTAAGTTAPRITLGGGGLASRNRPLQPVIPIPHGTGPTMHHRSLQLDNQRMRGRVRAHIDGLVREADAEYQDRGLAGRMRNAINRLGDVFGTLGWGAGGNEERERQDGSDGWATPPARGGWGGVRGRGGFGRGSMGWGEPPEEEEERPLNLPEAPEWKVWFTHPGKIPHGFTSEFAPMEPELIILEDSDEESKKKKGKGKAKESAADAEANARAQDTLTLVCSMCKDPLLLSGDTDDEKVYGLRCGHVLDGKCLWKIGKPADLPQEPEPDEVATTGPKLSKGKSRTMLDAGRPNMDIDPQYQFTFVPPVEAPTHTTIPQQSAYEEDNDPSAPAIHSRNTEPTRRRDRRGVVPIPNVSAARRSTRNRTRQNALDGVDDEAPPDSGIGGGSAPRLDLTDPFFPTVVVPPQPVGRGRGRRGARAGGAGAGGRRRMRRVPKTKGRLKEEVFDWTCPVAGCGRAHVSVRLDMEGAKWKCDTDKGAVLMFL